MVKKTQNKGQKARQQVSIEEKIDNSLFDDTDKDTLLEKVLMTYH